MLLNYQENRAISSFIPQDRTRKLELLIHLITHSKQALIICGPDGIGKSTLLNALQDYKNDSWQYCLILGNSELNFDLIQKQFNHLIYQTKSKRPELSTSSLHTDLQKKIVLLIDDAGYLESNLIKKIIEYAINNPILRVIFVLTNEEVESKNHSIGFIDDCHLIEIPVLSKPQCCEFLQYLSLKTQSKLSFNDINKALVKEIYLATEGIPGRIIARLADYDNNPKYNSSQLTLVAAVIGLIALALITQWLSAVQFRA